MGTGRRHRSGERGFVYIALLIGLAIVGIGLSAVSQVWTQTRLREKEEELLFVGNQFRAAISRYYLQSPPAARRFPNKLEELVDDTRTPDKPAHHLRKLFIDPMTQSNQWGEVRLPSGQIVGVYSMAHGNPIKVAGFAKRDKDFADKSSYSDWIFRSELPAANPTLAIGAGYSTNGGTGVPAPAGGGAGSKPPVQIPQEPLPPVKPLQPDQPPVIRPLPRPR